MLHQIFSGVDADALDLLTRMLAFDPRRRPTCEEIAHHAYFQKAFETGGAPHENQAMLLEQQRRRRHQLATENVSKITLGDGPPENQQRQQQELVFTPISEAIPEISPRSRSQNKSKRFCDLRHPGDALAALERAFETASFQADTENNGDWSEIFKKLFEDEIEFGTRLRPRVARRRDARPLLRVHDLRVPAHGDHRARPVHVARPLAHRHVPLHLPRSRRQRIHRRSRTQTRRRSRRRQRRRPHLPVLRARQDGRLDAPNAVRGRQRHGIRCRRRRWRWSSHAFAAKIFRRVGRERRRESARERRARKAAAKITRTRTRNEFTTKRVVVILKCCTEYP